MSQKIDMAPEINTYRIASRLISLEGNREYRIEVWLPTIFGHKWFTLDSFSNDTTKYDDISFTYNKYEDALTAIENLLKKEVAAVEQYKHEQKLKAFLATQKWEAQEFDVFDDLSDIAARRGM